MTPQVSDISRESTLNRLLRENAMVAMLLVFTVMIYFAAFITGRVVGDNAAAFREQAESYDRLKQHYDVTSIYVRQLHADLKAQGYELPTPPEELE